MAAVGDIYQLVAKCTYLEQECVNVYHYQLLEHGAGVGGSDDLNQDWSDQILPAVAAVQVDSVNWFELYTVNLNDPADFHLFALDYDGLIAATADKLLPAFVAFGFRYIRSNWESRDGSKRYVGVSQDVVTGNTYVGDTEDMDNIAAQSLENRMSNGWVFKPVIARRPIAYGENPVVYGISDIQFKGITTQNSRKR